MIPADRAADITTRSEPVALPAVPLVAAASQLAVSPFAARQSPRAAATEVYELACLEAADK